MPATSRSSRIFVDSARRLLLVLGLGLLACLGFGSVASAATFQVTTTADSNDGACTPSLCSLRDAVIAANATPANDTINLPAGHYTLTIPGNNETASATGDLNVASAATAGTLTITGGGARTTSIDASALGNDRVISVLTGGNLSMSGVTITGGYLQDQSGGGGGIASDGVLALDGVTVTGNSAPSNATFYGGAGGGLEISSNATATTITNSTFSNNKTSGDGGALLKGDDGTLSITNSTFSGNSVDTSLPNTPSFYGAFGGALEIDSGDVTITNSTLAQNNINDAPGHTRGSGKAFSIGGASLTLTNTIVADNTQTGSFTAPPRNCDKGPQTSQGVNLDDDASCANAPADKHSDPLLGPLANNGGQTDTMAITKSSPAFDAADTALAPGTDQRGVPRPQFAEADIGAFELQQSADLGVSASATPGAAGVGGNITYRFTVTNAGPDSANGVNLTVPLPGTVARVSSPGSCSGSSTLTCSLGNLAAGGSVTVTVVARGVRAGNASVSGTVSSGSGDPNPANNSAVARATVVAVSTGVAKPVGVSTATLHGTIGTGGQSVSWQFQYGRNNRYGKTTKLQSLRAGLGGTVKVSAALRGLRANTTYHFRLIVKTATGTVYGADRTFKTKALTVSVSPNGAPRAGLFTCYAFTVKSAGRAVRGASVSFVGHSARTSRRGVATICATVSAGFHTVRASARGLGAVSGRLLVRAAPRFTG